MGQGSQEELLALDPAEVGRRCTSEANKVQSSSAIEDIGPYLKIQTPILIVQRFIHDDFHTAEDIHCLLEGFEVDFNRPVNGDSIEILNRLFGQGNPSVGVSRIDLGGFITRNLD